MTAQIETFTHADTIGSWTADLTWVDQFTNNGAIVSNQAASSGTLFTNPAPAYSVTNTDTPSANQEVRVYANQMELTVTLDCYIGVVARAAVGTTARYEFRRVGAPTLGSFTCILYRYDASGNATAIAGPTTIARASLTTPEKLLMTVVGSTITCYLNDIQVLGVVDTTLTTQRRTGLTIREATTSASGTLADNFAAGDIGSTSTNRTLAAKAATASSSKAVLGAAKHLSAKAATSDKSFAAFRRSVHEVAKAAIVSAVRSDLTNLIDGFFVARALVAKPHTAFSAKADLTNHHRSFSAKVPSSHSMGGIFHPVALSVTHGSNQTKIATSHSAKALRIARNSGYVAKAFSSNGAKARLSGGHVYITAKCPIASSGFGTARSPLHMLAKLPITFSLKADTLTPAPTQHGLFFTPINPKEDPPTLPFDQMGPSYRLFRHYKSRPCGRNVYIYSDDTVNEYDPDGYTTLWRESDRTSSTNLNAPHVVHVFWGGHEGELVTPHEAALLTAAGYIVT